VPGIFVTVSKLRVVMLVVWLAAVLPWPAYAQERVYRPNIAEEDWSFLKDPSKRRDWWDPVKYIPFERDGWFMTLSGEARFRPEGFRIKATDTSPATRDQYLLQRYLFAADVHLGARTRLFAELQSGLITGKIGGSRPTDRNSADLHQAFLEWRSPRDAGTRFDVRIGRQELTIGSSRLISASPGLNVKRSFDGVRLAVSQKGWRVEAAAAELTELSAGAFDDRSMHEVRFWGVAAGRSAPWANGTWTAYYLGLRNEDMQYAQGRGQDMRHTIGVGVRGSGRLLDFNYDGIWQLGDFEGHEARA
jgi:hypothetical protein